MCSTQVALHPAPHTEPHFGSEGHTSAQTLGQGWRKHFVLKTLHEVVEDLKQLNKFLSTTKAELRFLHQQHYYFVSPGHIQKKKAELNIYNAINMQKPNHEQLQRLIQ